MLKVQKKLIFTFGIKKKLNKVNRKDLIQVQALDFCMSSPKQRVCCHSCLMLDRSKILFLLGLTLINQFRSCDLVVPRHTVNISKMFCFSSSWNWNVNLTITILGAYCSKAKKGRKEKKNLWHQCYKFFCIFYYTIL